MGWKKGEERKKSHFIVIATSRHVWHRALPPPLLLDIRVMHEKPTQATIGWELKESNVPYVKWKILNYMWIYIFLFMDFHSRLSALTAEVIKRRSRWEEKIESALSREILTHPIWNIYMKSMHKNNMTRLWIESETRNLFLDVKCEEWRSHLGRSSNLAEKK